MNGDGFDDVIIGAFQATAGGNTFAGVSYVVFGKADWSIGFTGAAAGIEELSALDGTNGFAIDGEAVNDYSGRSVASAGDLNGDGYVDIVVTNSSGEMFTGPSDGLRPASGQFPGPTFMFMNPGGDNHWITLRLKGRMAIDGTGSNADGIGARVYLKTSPEGATNGAASIARPGRGAGFGSSDGRRRGGPPAFPSANRDRPPANRAGPVPARAGPFESAPSPVPASPNSRSSRRAAGCPTC